MKVIFFMGNPGYQLTVHNIASDIGSILFSKKQTSINTFNFQKCLVVIAPCVVNVSGEILKNILKKLNISSEDLIVCCDDVESKPGTVRKRFGKLSKGHNGLRSIINNIGQNFWQVLIGVGKKEPLHQWVLSPHNLDLLPLVSRVIAVLQEIIM